jgi:predicted extracellular nuclease
MKITAAALIVLAAAISVAAQTTVFINEIHYDNASTDVGEAIEIAGPAGTDLTDWSIVLYNGSNGSSYNTTPLSGTIADICGGFGVIDVTYPSNGLQNGSPDGVALVDDGSAVVQFLSYEGSFVAVGGPADGLLSTDIGVAESTTTPVGDSLQLSGTGLAAEHFAWTAPSANTFGACNTGQTFGAPPVNLLINETDADTAGTDDTLEFVELYDGGVGSSPLDGFVVVFYNGSNDTSYNAFDLDGFSSDGSGYFLLGNAAVSPSPDIVFPSDGLQNGADAVALYQGNAADFPIGTAVTTTGLIDAIVYDTNDGDAAGLLMLLNAGQPQVNEDGAGDKDNHSNQRCPNGEGGERNTAGYIQGAPTPAADNQCDVPSGAVLVINEIDYDQSGTDAAEFVEIKNASTDPVNLGTYTLELVNGNGTVQYQSFDLPAVDLAPGDYFVVCGDAANVYNCDLDVSPDSNLVQNGSPDAVALWQDATLIDTVSYEGDTGTPYTEGSGAGLSDSSSIDFLGISRIPDGVDTNSNNVDLSTRCITPGAANVPDASSCPEPGPPTLAINEIDYDQPGSDSGEFIEIKNTGSSAIDLGSFSLELVNGSTGTVYKTVALPAIALAPGDYYVICGNAANVLNCDFDVSPDSNLIQNGAPDAVALMQGAMLIDTVSYEGDTVAPYTEGSGAGLVDSGSTGNDFKGISRLPDGFDSDQNNLDLAFVCITPGTSNTVADFGCSAAGPVLEIYEIQGSGAHSPFVGSPISTIDNVVIALSGNGFFIQTPTARTDGDPQTSDGIYVFTGSAPTVAVGDLVDVSGTVVEYFDFTEISGNPVVTADGTGAVPAPVMLDETLPSGFPADLPELESLEGMLVTASGIATGPSDRFGDIPVVARTVRSFREPGIVFPGIFGLPMWDGNPEVFEIDPDAGGLLDVQMFSNQAFDATGPLGFSFGDYQIWPTSLTPGPPPTLPIPASDPMPAEFAVASQNLLRLMSDNVATRAAKLSLHIRTVLNAPDILAVQEVDTLTTLQTLANQITADDPAVVYTPYLIEGNDIGGIDVGYLVRDTITVYNITQFGKDLQFEFNGTDYWTYDRPPLVLDAEYIGAGEPFPIVVINNHLRSLNDIEDETSIARTKRYEQALELSLFIQDFQTLYPDTPFVVTGDFNAFQFTDGYVDVMGQITGDIVPSDSLLPGTDEVDPNLFNEIFSLAEAERYSFVFEGNAQVLDHMLTSESIAPAVKGIEYARGNSDSPAELFEANDTTLRASDHDAVVLHILADTDFDGVPNGVDVCPGTAIPESVPTSQLGTNRWALVDDDGVFDTKAPKGNSKGPKRSFTIEDTAGCSCEQIIDELHLGKGHEKFGCSNGAMENWVSEMQN